MMSLFPAPRRAWLFGLFAVCTLAFLCSHSAAQQQQRILAPELDGGVGWLGIDKPLHLKDLRGKIVVFDFWTLC